jgi:hypothetical protein
MPRQRYVSRLCSGLPRRTAGLKLSVCTPVAKAGRETQHRALRDRQLAKWEHPPMRDARPLIIFGDYPDLTGPVGLLFPAH